MKGNITEEQLMNFLYGEIEAQDRKKVEEYLKNNPERQKEMEELGMLRSSLAKWKDEEDISIPDLHLYKSDADHLSNNWKRYFIAATVAFFVAFSWILFKDLYNGEPDSVPVVTLEQLDQIIKDQNNLKKQNQELITKINSLEGQLAEVNNLQNEQQTILASYKPSANTVDEKLVKEYMLSMREEQRAWLEENLESSLSQQQQYLQSVLLDYNAYVSEQRRQDILVLETRLQNLEQNTDEFQYQASQVMASLAKQDLNLRNQ